MLSGIDTNKRNVLVYTVFPVPSVDYIQFRNLRLLGMNELDSHLTFMKIIMLNCHY